ncbi:SDR family oxidoreductase [Microbacterium hominis]|uniref:SDR family oxidoreductase n=1 Tax=Microbacterium hominis TaxID=162426 RepID=A0A7D4UA93_9MICO|nr:SDR family oxidoreductase [Microbacterium hominis]QKJ18203.1 SDR family oxidoreductase [Microbacterium hominis]
MAASLAAPGRGGGIHRAACISAPARRLCAGEVDGLAVAVARRTTDRSLTRPILSEETNMDAATPPRRWTIDLPDLSGRRALVTGASDGVGLEIARDLASAGAHVLMPVRNRAKGEAVVARLTADAPAGRFTLYDLDLASTASARTLAADLMSAGARIDIVVINAGIVMLGDPVRHLTADGTELHLQTNFLGHAALLAGILPLLQASRTRLAVQCSLAVRTGRVQWDDPQLEHGYRAMRAYAASKAALALYATELARRSDTGGWGLRTVLCHPGVAMTNIAPPEMQARDTLLTRVSGALLTRGVFGQCAADAALPALHAVTAAGLRSGDLVVPSRRGGVMGPPVGQRRWRSLRDAGEAARAVDLADRLTGVRLAAASAGGMDAAPGAASAASTL